MINDKSSAPLFTLRGHDVGVTALAESQSNESRYLVSGDESGTVIFWDLSTLKKVSVYKNQAPSRIQSLRIISFVERDLKKDLLVLQSRDDGIQILKIDYPLKSLFLLETFPTYSSLFSKGDSISIDENHAILAHPSCLENYLVTVRVIDVEAKTLLSGTAQRSNESPKNGSVFDIRVRTNATNRNFILSVAYEDGHICVYSISLNSTQTVPVIQSTGLKIDLIIDHDLKIGDFVSAFDIVQTKLDSLELVCGSPKKKLTFLVKTLSTVGGNKPNEDVDETINLKRPGVSAIKIRPDGEVVAVGCWDNSVELYSMRSHKPLAKMRHHLKQVQDITFVEQPDVHQKLKQDDTTYNKYLLCCASQEGTITLTSV